MGGDSGAWVIDNMTGAVCGHVMAWNERDSAGILAPMEVMFHDMEHTLGKPVSLPAAGSERQRSYKDQIVVDRDSLSAAEGDEAVDMAYQSAEEDPRAHILAGKATFDQSIGSQFAAEPSSASPTVPLGSEQLARETSADSSAYSYFSDADTSELDRLEGTSLSPTPPSSASPSLPTTRTTLRDLKLDDVSERWTQSQISRQDLENGALNGHRIPRKPVRSGLRAQC